jgi:uncharacterized protein
MTNQIQLYPGTVAVKVFIHDDEKTKNEIIGIVKNIFPHLADTEISSQHSTKQKFQSIIFKIYVEDKKDIEALYQVISQHPEVKMVL